MWSVATRSSVSTVTVPAGDALAAELAAIRAGSGGGGGGGGGEDVDSFASAETPSQMMNPPFVQSLHFSADGRYLASAGGDGSVHVYATITGKLKGCVVVVVAVVPSWSPSCRRGRRRAILVVVIVVPSWSSSSS